MRYGSPEQERRIMPTGGHQVNAEYESPSLGWEPYLHLGCDSRQRKLAVALRFGQTVQRELLCGLTASFRWRLLSNCHARLDKCLQSPNALQPGGARGIGGPAGRLVDTLGRDG